MVKAVSVLTVALAMVLQRLVIARYLGRSGTKD